jgi:hypothetical protein
MGFDLAKEALLARLSTGQWTGRTRCKTLNEEAAERHSIQADPDNAMEEHKVNPKRIESYIIQLDKSVRTAIQRVVDHARQYFNDRSQIWDLGSWRLLPSSEYNDMRAKMSTFRDQFIKIVDETVLKDYDKIKDLAAKELGDLIDIVGFPEKEDLKNRYRFRFETTPIANPDDLRVRHLDASTTAVLQEEVKKQYGERMQKSVQALVDGIKKEVHYLADRFGSDRKFKSEMLDHKVTQIGAIRDLNRSMLSDPVIEALASSAIDTLGEYDADVLRNDKAAREEFAGHMATLEENIEKVKAGIGGDVGVVEEPEPEEQSEMGGIL